MNNIIKHEFFGQLLGVPFANKPSAALARCMPLSNENDFEIFAKLPCSKAPILLNFIEHYQILNQLVSLANELWQQDITILIRISMPGGMRLPAALLAPNVLLMQDIQPEVNKLAGKVKHLLTIDDDFIRYQLEKGNNDISVILYTLIENQQDSFSKFIAQLEQFNIGAK